jgi:hypothetical protein
VTEDDEQRVEAARERAIAQAEDVFGSLTPEQLEIMQTGAAAGGDGTYLPVDRDELGTIYDQNGWMRKADYDVMERIISDFQAGRPPGDDDFEMLINHLSCRRRTRFPSIQR